MIKYTNFNKLQVSENHKHGCLGTSNVLNNKIILCA